MQQLHLGEKEINKLALITNMTPMQINKLLNLRLLDRNNCLDALLVYDYKRLKRRTVYRISQIVPALMERYNISEYRVKKAVYKKAKLQRVCECCQKEISGLEYSRGNGKCNECIAASIEF